MTNIEIHTVEVGNKRLATMNVLKYEHEFDEYDCIIDSGADTFHVNMTEEELGKLDFVPFHQLNITYQVTLPLVNGERGKFAKVKVGTASGDVPALEGILRCVKIGNLMIKHAKCTVTLLPSTKNSYAEKPIFLFPLFYIFKRNIWINQEEHKIESQSDGNTVCFTYRYGDENRRVYGMVKDIDKVPYENMLKMDDGERIQETNSFIEN